MLIFRVAKRTDHHLHNQEAIKNTELHNPKTFPERLEMVQIFNKTM